MEATPSRRSGHERGHQRELTTSLWRMDLKRRAGNEQFAISEHRLHNDWPAVADGSQDLTVGLVDQIDGTLAARAVVGRYSEHPAAV